LHLSGAMFVVSWERKHVSSSWLSNWCNAGKFWTFGF